MRKLTLPNLWNPGGKPIEGIWEGKGEPTLEDIAAIYQSAGMGPVGLTPERLDEIRQLQKRNPLFRTAQAGEMVPPPSTPYGAENLGEEDAYTNALVEDWQGTLQKVRGKIPPGVRAAGALPGAVTGAIFAEMAEGAKNPFNRGNPLVQLAGALTGGEGRRLYDKEVAENLSMMPPDQVDTILGLPVGTMPGAGDVLARKGLEEGILRKGGPLEFITRFGGNIATDPLLPAKGFRAAGAALSGAQRVLTGASLAQKVGVGARMAGAVPRVAAGAYHAAGAPLLGVAYLPDLAMGALESAASGEAATAALQGLAGTAMAGGLGGAAYEGRAKSGRLFRENTPALAGIPQSVDVGPGAAPPAAPPSSPNLVPLPKPIEGVRIDTPTGEGTQTQREVVEVLGVSPDKKVFQVRTEVGEVKEIPAGFIDPRQRTGQRFLKVVNATLDPSKKKAAESKKKFEELEKAASLEMKDLTKAQRAAEEAAAKAAQLEAKEKRRRAAEWKKQEAFIKKEMAELGAIQKKAEKEKNLTAQQQAQRRKREGFRELFSLQWRRFEDLFPVWERDLPDLSYYVDEDGQPLAMERTRVDQRRDAQGAPIIQRGGGGVTSIFHPYEDLPTFSEMEEAGHTRDRAMGGGVEIAPLAQTPINLLNPSHPLANMRVPITPEEKAKALLAFRTGEGATSLPLSLLREMFDDPSARTRAITLGDIEEARRHPEWKRSQDLMHQLEGVLEGKRGEGEEMARARLEEANQKRREKWEADQAELKALRELKESLEERGAAPEKITEVQEEIDSLVGKMGEEPPERVVMTPPPTSGGGRPLSARPPRGRTRTQPTQPIAEGAITPPPEVPAATSPAMQAATPTREVPRSQRRAPSWAARQRGGLPKNIGEVVNLELPRTAANVEKLKVALREAIAKVKTTILNYETKEQGYQDRISGKGKKNLGFQSEAKRTQGLTYLSHWRDKILPDLREYLRALEEGKELPPVRDHALPGEEVAAKVEEAEKVLFWDPVKEQDEIEGEIFTQAVEAVEKGEVTPGPDGPKVGKNPESGFSLNPFSMLGTLASLIAYAANKAGVILPVSLAGDVPVAMANIAGFGAFQSMALLSDAAMALGGNARSKMLFEARVRELKDTLAKGGRFQGDFLGTLGTFGHGLSTQQFKAFALSPSGAPLSPNAPAWFKKSQLWHQVVQRAADTGVISTDLKERILRATWIDSESVRQQKSKFKALDSVTEKITRLMGAPHILDRPFNTLSLRVAMEPWFRAKGIPGIEGLERQIVQLMQSGQKDAAKALESEFLQSLASVTGDVTMPTFASSPRVRGLEEAIIPRTKEMESLIKEFHKALPWWVLKDTPDMDKLIGQVGKLMGYIPEMIKSAPFLRIGTLTTPLEAMVTFSNFTMAATHTAMEITPLLGLYAPRMRASIYHNSLKKVLPVVQGQLRQAEVNFQNAADAARAAIPGTTQHQQMVSKAQAAQAKRDNLRAQVAFTEESITRLQQDSIYSMEQVKKMQMVFPMVALAGMLSRLLAGEDGTDPTAVALNPFDKEDERTDILMVLGPLAPAWIFGDMLTRTSLLDSDYYTRSTKGEEAFNLIRQMGESVLGRNNPITGGGGTGFEIPELDGASMYEEFLTRAQALGQALGKGGFLGGTIDRFTALVSPSETGWRDLRLRPDPRALSPEFRGRKTVEGIGDAMVRAPQEGAEAFLRGLKMSRPGWATFDPTIPMKHNRVTGERLGEEFPESWRDFPFLAGVGSRTKVTDFSKEWARLGERQGIKWPSSFHDRDTREMAFQLYKEHMQEDVLEVLKQREALLSEDPLISEEQRLKFLKEDGKKLVDSLVKKAYWQTYQDLIFLKEIEGRERGKPGQGLKMLLPSEREKMVKEALSTQYKKTMGGAVHQEGSPYGHKGPSPAQMEKLMRGPWMGKENEELLLKMSPPPVVP